MPLPSRFGRRLEPLMCRAAAATVDAVATVVVVGVVVGTVDAVAEATVGVVVGAVGRERQLVAQFHRDTGSGIHCHLDLLLLSMNLQAAWIVQQSLCAMLNAAIIECHND
jgi:hypothetical protein